MVKNFFVPFIYILIFLISKEMFSYESEKVVILCLLSFFIMAYYYIKTTLHENFLSTSEKLVEEFNELLKLKIEYEKKIKIFWHSYLYLEKILTKNRFCVEKDFQSIINNNNNRRILFSLNIIKDILNVNLIKVLVVKNLFKQLHLVDITKIYSFLYNYVLNTNFIYFLDKSKSYKNKIMIEKLIIS